MYDRSVYGRCAAYDVFATMVASLGLQLSTRSTRFCSAAIEESDRVEVVAADIPCRQALNLTLDF